MRGLAARYPMLAVGEFGRSVLGRPLWYLTLGSGPKLVFYNAAHHANEWITTPLLLTFCEQLCARLGDGGDMEGQNIRDLLSSLCHCFFALLGKIINTGRVAIIF